MAAHTPFQQAVYAMVCRIPAGQVASYAQVGTYLGSPGLARAVGTALSHLTAAEAKVVPWHRVIKGDGRVAGKGDWKRPPKQVRLLRAEGIPIALDGMVPLELFGWHGPEDAGAMDTFRSTPGGRRVRSK